jgi:hypothetical protein
MWRWAVTVWVREATRHTREVLMLVHPSLARQWANARGQTMQRNYPLLSVGYTLDTLLLWLGACDPHGAWIGYGYDEVPTMDDARFALCEWAGDDWAAFVAEPAGYPVTCAGFLLWCGGPDS